MAKVYDIFPIGWGAGALRAKAIFLRLLEVSLEFLRCSPSTFGHHKPLHKLVGFLASWRITSVGLMYLIDLAFLKKMYVLRCAYKCNTLTCCWFISFLSNYFISENIILVTNYMFHKYYIISGASYIQFTLSWKLF